MEDESRVPHALLIIGIVAIIVCSICIAWLIVLCERCRRKRKYRPGVQNRSLRGVSRGPGDDPQITRHFLHPPRNKGHHSNLVIANKGFLSKSTPEIALHTDNDLLEPILQLGHIRRSSLSFSASSEPPLLPFEEISVHDQIQAILGTFPDLKFMGRFDSSTTTSSDIIKLDAAQDNQQSKNNVEVVVEKELAPLGGAPPVDDDEGPETGVDEEPSSATTEEVVDGRNSSSKSSLSSHPSLLPQGIQLLWGQSVGAHFETQVRDVRSPTRGATKQVDDEGGPPLETTL